MSEQQAKNISQLVASFHSEDPVTRQQAREALVEHGSAAVPALTKALQDAQSVVRWEAAKSLAEIADVTAAEPLVAALGDTDPDVVWVAGEALIALRRAALSPLLRTLIQGNQPLELYRGAHHVLRKLVARSDSLRPLLTPVLQALDQQEPQVSVPGAAAEALKNVERNPTARQ